MTASRSSDFIFKVALYPSMFKWSSSNSSKITANLVGNSYPNSQPLSRVPTTLSQTPSMCQITLFPRPSSRPLSQPNVLKTPPRPPSNPPPAQPVVPPTSPVYLTLLRCHCSECSSCETIALVWFRVISLISFSHFDDV
jgi:hypothetical protein